MKYKMSNKFNKEFINENLMGPNAMKMLEEMLEEIEIKPNMRIIDLGCGKALTSLLLAENFDVKVYAVDLWISATENYRRIKDLNLEDKIIPIHCDANELCFADDYFDLIVSIDSYHYFGNNTDYLTKLNSLLKDNGKLIVVVPGVKSDEDNIFEKFKEFIPKEAFNIYSMNWWLHNFENSNVMKVITAKELLCYDEAWQEWLNTDNEFSINDRPMIDKVGTLMNLLGFVLEKKHWITVFFYLLLFNLNSII